eukprot:scaffold92535_cov15-Tisochrysis_lutea.AAC.1
MQDRPVSDLLQLCLASTESSAYAWCPAHPVPGCYFDIGNCSRVMQRVTLVIGLHLGCFKPLFVSINHSCKENGASTLACKS